MNDKLNDKMSDKIKDTKDMQVIQDPMIEKVRTFKSGKFIFSRYFGNENISRAYFEATILNNTIKDLPILPHLAVKLNEELIIKSIFGTAAIEGNPLGPDEVGKVLASPEGAQTTQRVHKEILNLKEAYRFAEGLDYGGAEFVLNEEYIQIIHSIITKDIEHPQNRPGQYRNEVVYVGDAQHGGSYRAPKILDDVRTLMKKFVEWINSEDVKKCQYTPYSRAALAHYHLALIHPFFDGNGRTARLIEGILLRAAGIKYLPKMLSNYYYSNVDDYYRAFSHSIHSTSNDISPFMEFYFRGVVQEFQEIKTRIIFFIREFALRDYFTHLLTKSRIIIGRQYNLLALLLDNPQDFTIEDLFEKPLFKPLYSDLSKRTAMRDLKKLTHLNLLRSQDGLFSLNFRAIDEALDRV